VYILEIPSDPNTIAYSTIGFGVAPFRTAGREEKGRVYLVGAARRRRRHGAEPSPPRKEARGERGSTGEKRGGRGGCASCGKLSW
jgi:hypothetical protein